MFFKGPDHSGEAWWQGLEFLAGLSLIPFSASLTVSVDEMILKENIQSSFSSMCFATIVFRCRFLYYLWLLPLMVASKSL